MAQTLPANHIEAQIGDVSGGSQVAVGSYIVQIGRVEGGVVNILNGPSTAPRSRPQPVRLLPRAFPGLLDRQTESSSVIQALQSKESVECSGQPGSGKTSLLRHLAYQQQLSTFSAGVIYFQVNQQSNADLLKSFFDAFYEYDSPVKPTETEIRHYLQSLNALILLDDVETTPEQLEALMNIAPNCTFLAATAKRSLFGQTREVTLKGLPTGEAVSLFQREFGRELSAEEQKGAQYLCESVDCIPQRVLRAAHQAREENRSLLEIAPQAKSSSLDQTLAAAEVKPRSDDEKNVLSALAVFYGAPVAAEHVAAVAGISDISEMLDNFEKRGLVQSHDHRYTLASDVNNALLGDLKPGLARALAHFVEWTEQHHHQPEIIAASAQPILLILQWAVAAKKWAEAKRLGHATEEALALSGKWDMWATALQSILKSAQGLQDRANEAWALHQLGTRALCLGARSAAQGSLSGALAIRESLNDQSGAAVTRHNLNILLNPPPTKQEPDKSGGADSTTPTPTPTPIPLLLKLGLGLLALALIGVFLAWWFWPPRPAEAPAVVSFTVNPASVPLNGQAQLCYEVKNASSVRIEPDTGQSTPADKGCVTVTPQQTTTYTLTAFGADGKAIDPLQINLKVDVPPVQIVRFEVSRDLGPGGENDVQFRLCYEVRNAQHAELDNNGGEVILDESHCQQVKPEQTTIYTLTATGADGQTVSQQVEVSANKPPPPLPRVLYFTASPQNIGVGDKAQLCFQLKDASSVQIDAGVAQLEAQPEKQCVSVTPIKTTTYTLTALNSEGKTDKKQVTLRVNKPAPQIMGFTAKPDSLDGAGRVQLCYDVVNAGSLRISPNVGEVNPLNKGCNNTTVNETTTFTLTAIGADGRAVKQQTTVTVKAKLKHAQIIDFHPSEARIKSGASVSLCYEIADAERAFLDRRPVAATRQCIDVSPTTSTDYVLTAIGEDRQSETRRIRVEVVLDQPPQLKHARIVDFTASPPSVKAGTTVRLCYSIVDAEKASLAPISRNVRIDKDCIEDTPRRSTRYVLNATGEDKETVSQTVIVEVEAERSPPVRIKRFEINPTMVHGTQLCYEVENARSARIDPGFGELTRMPADCPRLRSLEPTTYTLIATGQDGSTARRSVTYTPPERPKPTPIRIISFTPATQTIKPGTTAKICYVTDGEGSAQISPQPGNVQPSILRFRRCVTVSPRQSTDYVLTVTGPGGEQDSRRVTVKVEKPGTVIL